MIIYDNNGDLYDQIVANRIAKKETSSRRFFRFKEILIHANSASVKKFQRKIDSISSNPRQTCFFVLNPCDVMEQHKIQPTSDIINQFNQILEYSIRKVDFSEISNLKLTVWHPSLGKIQLKINCHNHILNIGIHVSDFEALKIISSNLDSIKRRLERKKINLKGLNCKFGPHENKP